MDQFYTLESSEDKIQIPFATYEPLIEDADTRERVGGSELRMWLSR